jgi:DNA-binding response OmpR family regulator
MRVLIADDDQRILDSLKKSFTGERFRVDTALTAQAAEQFLQNGNYDCAVLDWLFDGEQMTGYDLMKKVRALGKNFPIILLTVRNVLYERVAVLRDGADDCILKPFHFPELITRVYKILERQKNAGVSAQKFKNGPVVLDPFTHIVTLQGANLRLNHKEFQILRLFMIKLGDVIERSEFLEKIWDNQDGPRWSNTLEVHIRRLRERLGKYGHLIETVRGSGYRMKKL